MLEVQPLLDGLVVDLHLDQPLLQLPLLQLQLREVLILPLQLPLELRHGSHELVGPLLRGVLDFLQAVLVLVEQLGVLALAVEEVSLQGDHDVVFVDYRLLVGVYPQVQLSQLLLPQLSLVSELRAEGP